MKDGHVNDAAQGVAEDVPQGVAKDLAGLGRRAPSSPRHHGRRPVFVQLALRWGRNWAAQWHLAWAVGKRFRGCRAKRLYVHMCEDRQISRSNHTHAIAALCGYCMGQSVSS